jgi:exonuclease III
LSWNIEGLKSKLYNYDIIEFLKIYDVIGIQETWDLEPNYCEDQFLDFAIFSSAAKKSYAGGRPMGGITVFVKNTISKYFKRVCNEFNFGLMLLIDKSLFELERDILYVSLYIPPDCSPFYNDITLTGLQQLELFLIENKLLDLELMLSGDFNARTGDLCDFTTSTNDIPELKEFNDIFDNDIGVKRVSRDTKTNKFGHELLNFCKVFSCYIVNGRVGKCTGSDGFTFINQNGCSTIDYFIVSRNIFELITSFEIQSNTESCHFPISMSVKSLQSNCKKINVRNEDLFYDLHKGNCEAYLNCLSENILNGGFAALDTMLRDHDIDINLVMQEFESVICSSSVQFERIKENRLTL